MQLQPHWVWLIGLVVFRWCIYDLFVSQLLLLLFIAVCCCCRCCCCCLFLANPNPLTSESELKLSAYVTFFSFASFTCVTHMTSIQSIHRNGIVSRACMRAVKLHIFLGVRDSKRKRETVCVCERESPIERREKNSLNAKQTTLEMKKKN